MGEGSPQILDPHNVDQEIGELVGSAGDLPELPAKAGILEYLRVEHFHHAGAGAGRETMASASPKTSRKRRANWVASS